MSLIKRMLRDVCVLWKRDGVDEYGAFRWTAPVEIKCRWEEIEQVAVNRKDSAAGIQDMPKESPASLVYVDRDLSPGDILWYGKLADVPAGTDPATLYKASEVKRFDKLPDMRIREYLRKAYL